MANDKDFRVKNGLLVATDTTDLNSQGQIINSGSLGSFINFVDINTEFPETKATIGGNIDLDFSAYSYKINDNNMLWHGEGYVDTNTVVGKNAGTTTDYTSSNLTLLGHGAEPSSPTATNEVTLGDSNVKSFRIPGVGMSVDSTGLLTVNNISISGDITIDSDLVVNTIQVNDSARVTGNFTVDTDTLHVDATNDRVGVGNTSPTTALDVTGTVTADQYNNDESMPTSNPSLSLDFGNSVQIDPRINFSRASIGTYFDGQYIRTAGPDEPRIEYAADGTVKGLLIEEQRENLTLYSNTFSTGWTTDGCSVAQDATGVDGATSAWTVTGDGTSGGDVSVRRTFGVTGGAQYVWSCFVKAGTATWARIETFDGVGSHVAFYDLANGVVGSASASFTDYDIIPYGNGFYRIWATRAVDAAATDARMQITQADADNVVTSPTSSKTLIVYGAQSEQGSFLTSYIPTNGSAATREPDIATVPVSEFNYNTDAGTVVVEFDTVGGADISDIHYLLSGDHTNARWAFHNSADTMKAYDGSTSRNILTTQDDLPTTHKIAVAVDASTLSTAADGGSTISNLSTNGNISALTTAFRLGSNQIGTNQLNGHIRSLKYWPQRLSDATLQAVTQG